MERRSPMKRAGAYLKKGRFLNQGWTEESPRSREWEDLYRGRWEFDKVVRSTHGVNCTGSCSWKVYVKNGIITWETQQTDYPSMGPDFPEYEPRGCPRGASFSWYEYSPLRIKYPYVRQTLLEKWRALLNVHKDPVVAYHALMHDPEARREYQRQRGKGGFVRASWDEVETFIAAGLIDTIKTYGPDRIFGFTPIPAMSMVSYAAGSRFLSLLGGVMLSFYDHYADLPPASPEVWGEQTDVPESADWYNSGYLIIWGTNLPMTRTPDAHYMVEARLNGTKVVGISPDYAEYVKFADLWMAPRPGTDAALAMAMTHVILKEFYVDRQTPYFLEYVKQYTDLPFLVRIDRRPLGEYVTGRFLEAADLEPDVKNAAWKPAMWDKRRNGPAIPIGSMGFRWDGSGKWNLNLEDDGGTPLEPELSLVGQADEVVSVNFPYFASERPTVLSRRVPVKRMRLADGEDVRVATVFDLLMANVGVSRNLEGEPPVSYDDVDAPYTPAWQEAITGVGRDAVIAVAREFAANAEKTRGRSMIAMGAGTNHWYHSDMIYRAMLTLVFLTGSEGVNGGGWAHYVGQEKVRPLEGWSGLAFARDWIKPARLQQGTMFFYFASDQFRFEELDSAKLLAPFADPAEAQHPADALALAARLGWMPSYPQFNENPLQVVQTARDGGAESHEAIQSQVIERLKDGSLKLAVHEPDAPENFPRIMFIWRANLLGASAKGSEYFIKYLLGADGHVLGDESPYRPKDIEVPDEAPEGKLDLWIDVDFRMTSSGLYADIVLPAATWYEKYDLSTTDMHPFIHPFNPAITPPWKARPDWDTFSALAHKFSLLATTHLPGVHEDLVMAPLLHDSPEELAQPFGEVKDWTRGEVEPVPGKTMPKLVIIPRDYPHLYDQMISIGPQIEVGFGTKGITISGEPAYAELKHNLGVSTHEGPSKGRPSISRDNQVANAILILSGASNGRRAVEEWESLEKVTGLHLKEIALPRKDEMFLLDELTAQPRLSIAGPAWSGLESEGRRYSPFTVNVDYHVPWRTLTGRQHFYLDHAMMRSFGEALPLYRPPIDLPVYSLPESQDKTIVVRYLTPHQKWGIHTTYWDNPRMTTLFRGGQTVWLSPGDAAQIDVDDNDWIEVFNQNGVTMARAVVSHRIPEGAVFMYHAQDRTVGVPLAPATGDRGGNHNSATRTMVKPTHVIGGYAQFSYDFNYWGPTGHQRDTRVRIRKAREVKWQ
ncbi:nitrate reductase subunit alpha [Sulfobacillus harzensis]|uniref:nitrate reductase (quinone) n=1 Tax=Sulfobacillus harzensis TaxID=2729629 RepID=A0A7Y0Q4H3_9FIRM|nr:nitrate reductase subunit alpha [Sulfobacillus harzensis]NMP23254.1 nitrate reductase subunit alpha [Sulfobacillus harzensis]